MKGRLLEVTYEDFINNILETRGRNGCGDEYHETHHIVPKCMGGTNDKENLIDLFAREHFEAHRLLALENPENKKLTYAWWCMSVQTNEYTKERYKITAEEYEEVRKIYAKLVSESMSGEKNRFYGVHNCGKDHPNYGKPMSDEQKEKISITLTGKYTKEEHPNYGKKLSEERKRKISETLTGKLVGAKNPHSKIAVQCDNNSNVIKVWDYIKHASDNLQINKANIVACCRNKLNSAGGYIWKYLYDQTRKDGTIIPGAITLGLITEEEALKMLEEQKDTEGLLNNEQK